MKIVLTAQMPLPKGSATGGGTASWQAAWISALLHAGVLVALGTLLLPHRPPEASSQPGFDIVMTLPTVTAIEQSLQETPIKSAPDPVISALSVPRPLSLAAPPSPPATVGWASAHHVPKARAPGNAIHAALTNSTPSQLSPAAPANPSPALPENLLSGLESRIGRAVQEAAIYPASARLMHVQGRTQVRFDYSDGSAAMLAVATSSTSPILDRAALAAVRNAALPRAPASIGGRKLPVLVWVDFHLVQQD